MNKIYLLALCIALFVSCNKKVKEQPKSMAQLCAELYPCPIPKDSVKIDTVTIMSPPQYVVKTEKVIVKGDTITIEKTDTIYPIPTERIITKTVIRTVKDSALMQVYKDNIFALERRILDNEKEIGDLKLQVIKVKGSKNAYMIATILLSLLLALIAAFLVYVYVHNKK